MGGNFIPCEIQYRLNRVVQAVQATYKIGETLQAFGELESNSVVSEHKWLVSVSCN